MNRLMIWNRLRWWWRLPLKAALFSIVLLLVCYPDPRLLIRHAQRWRDPHRLIQPNAPALQPFADELQSRMPREVSPEAALRRVEKFVHEKIPYEWDWNTWGAADYLPTLEEILSAGKEDCDGRAVVAASLLARLGYQAEIVTDLGHVWVTTEHGDTMGPGKSKAVIGTTDGAQIQPTAVLQLPRSLGLGVAVFPLGRELILLVAWWALLLGRDCGLRGMLASMALLVFGLMMLRWGGADYRAPNPWVQWPGIAGLIGGSLCARPRRSGRGPKILEADSSAGAKAVGRSQAM